MGNRLGIGWHHLLDDALFELFAVTWHCLVTFRPLKVKFTGSTHRTQGADKGQYIASESSYYRVLREVDQVNRRGRAEAPKSRTKPKGFKAEKPNEVWSWDITYLASSLKGSFYYLYLIEDIFSRKIVGWEIHEKESAAHASVLIRKACLSEGVHQEGLVLHSDNGSPMKGATMLATLQSLGVVPSW